MDTAVVLATSDRVAPLGGIQILRAVAALLVVFHHALEESLAANTGPKSPDWLTTFGASGVDIFFVISGFIMFYVSFPHNEQPIAPSRFLLKRVLRIYPLYWFCIALVLGLWEVGLFKSLLVNISTLERSIFLLPSTTMIIGIAWTMVYEMYFYLIFAVTLIFANSKVSLYGTGAAILTFYALGQFAPDEALRDFLENPIALEFCFGLLLGSVFTQVARLPDIIRLLWIPGFAFLAAAPLIVYHPTTANLPGFARVWAWGLPAFMIVLSFLKLDLSRSRLQKFMVPLGDASYALYLTHPFVMITYARLLKGSLADLPQWPVVPVVVALSAGLGLATYILVERKLMAITRHLFSRQLSSPRNQGVPAPATTP